MAKLPSLLCLPAENPCCVSSGLVRGCRDSPAPPPPPPLGPSGCPLVQPEDGEVREDRKDRRGLLRGGLQVQEQRHGADRRHQEVCGVRGRPHHQKDRTEGDPDAQGKSMLLSLIPSVCPLCLRF